MKLPARFHDLRADWLAAGFFNMAPGLDGELVAAFGA